MTPQRVIELLGLEPHPREGGFFRETHRSKHSVPLHELGSGYSGDRSASTAIYSMLTRDTCSAMHRLPGDEVFHDSLGASVEMVLLSADASARTVMLGNHLASGDRPQVVVPGGVWQGSRIVGDGSFALLGATMAPGFDDADYEHGDREWLISRWPSERDRIVRLT